MKNEIKMSKEYSHGFTSFQKNNGEYINPYTPNTKNYSDFERGWSQAYRKQPASSFINGRYAPNGEVFENKAEQEHRLKEKQKKSQKEAYLKAKGE